jgi:hypothetical protein
MAGLGASTTPKIGTVPAAQAAVFNTQRRDNPAFGIWGVFVMSLLLFYEIVISAFSFKNIFSQRR